MRGLVLLLAIQNEREWRLFCREVLERPNLALEQRFSSNSERVANRPALRQIINDVFAQLSREEAVARLDAAKIANAQMRSVPSFLEHPQLRARNRWQEVDSPAGPIPALLPAATFEGIEPRLDPIPALGQHTESIRTPGGQELFYARSAVVTAAAAYRLQAVDMVTINFSDLTALEQECSVARQLGYTGKMAIHPRQVEPINRLFAPSAPEIEQALRLVQAYHDQAAAGIGAFALDGRMVDMPVVRSARQVLHRARLAGLLPDA